jgi:hypothetical protein
MALSSSAFHSAPSAGTVTSSTPFSKSRPFVAAADGEGLGGAIAGEGIDW